MFVEADQLSSWPALALAEGVTAASGHARRSGARRCGRPARPSPGCRSSRSPWAASPSTRRSWTGSPTLFPAARVSWIYASSEAGASIAVHDGRAGFPVSWLDRSTAGRPRLSVADGELLIESDWSADGFTGAVRTGDRAEVVGDRVHITGRLATDEINVGGSKVSAAAVRRVLLAHPSVAWAQVRARRAPLVGAVVAADLVLDARDHDRGPHPRGAPTGFPTTPSRGASACWTRSRSRRR